jgi:hypothetical protein
MTKTTSANSMVKIEQLSVAIDATIDSTTKRKKVPSFVGLFPHVRKGIKGSTSAARAVALC